MREVKAWTDGSSNGVVGPGGWGFVAIVGGEEVIERSGSARRTTNQRMEMIAAIMVLKEFPPEHQITIHSDAAYLINCMRQKWYLKWQSNSWRNSRKKPVKNRRLWEILIELAVEDHGDCVEWVKVKGHVRIIRTESHKHNARADQLAVEAKRKGMEGR